MYGFDYGVRCRLNNVLRRMGLHPFQDALKDLSLPWASRVRAKHQVDTTLGTNGSREYATHLHHVSPRILPTG